MSDFTLRMVSPSEYKTDFSSISLMQAVGKAAKYFLNLMYEVLRATADVYSFAIAVTSKFTLLAVAALCRFTGIGENFASRCTEKAMAIAENQIRIATVPTAIAVALKLAHVISKWTAIDFLFSNAYRGLRIIAAVAATIWTKPVNAWLERKGVIAPSAEQASAETTEEDLHDELAQAVFAAAAVSVLPFPGLVASSAAAALGATVGQRMLSAYRSFAAPAATESDNDAGLDADNRPARRSSSPSRM